MGAPFKLVVNVWHDSCVEDPTEHDGWKIHSFGRRHHNNVKPEDVGFEYDYDKECHVPDKDLQAKLDAGLAFMLDYYEHGQCMWSLSGEGPQCRWDTARFAGIMVWETDAGDLGPVEPDERRADAKRTIERYTTWCNGSAYGFNIDVVQACGECGKDKDIDSKHHDIDDMSCGGFLIDESGYEDIDCMIECIKDNIGENWADYEVEFKNTEHAEGVVDTIKSRWKGK